MVKAETKNTAPRLSFAFELYLKTHQRGKDESFIQKQQRDWNTLIGTSTLAKLNRNRTQYEGHNPQSPPIELTEPALSDGASRVRPAAPSRQGSRDDYRGLRTLGRT